LKAFFGVPTLRGLCAQFARAGAPAERAALPRRAAGTEAPASFAQERLWMLEQLDPATPAYHFCMAARLRGRVDVGRLRQALAGLALRHEALRTTFREQDGLPCQVIHADLPPPFEVVDLSLRASPGRVGAAEQALRDAARSPFDLVNGPLARTLLIRLSD